MYWLLDYELQESIRERIVDLQLELSRSRVRNQNEQLFPFNGRKNRDIAEKIVAFLTPENGVVCDPFSGTGTFPYAALDAGRTVKMNEWEPYAFRMSTAPFRYIPTETEFDHSVDLFKGEVEPVMNEIYKTRCPRCGRTLMFESIFYDRVPENYFTPMRHNRMGANGENVIFRKHKCECGCKLKFFDDYDLQVKLAADAMRVDFPDDSIIENSRLNFTAPEFTHYSSLFPHREQFALMTIEAAIQHLPDETRDTFFDAFLSIIHLAKYVDYHSKSQDNHCPDNRLREHNLYYVFLDKLKERRRYLSKQSFDLNKVSVACMDYRDFLADISPESVDLLLTDPPYGDNAQHFEHAQRVHPFLCYHLADDNDRLRREVVISNSPERTDKHGKAQFMNDIETLFSAASRVVKEHGYLVLYFRPEQSDWLGDLNSLKKAGRKNGFEPLVTIPIDQRDPSMRALASAAWTFKKDICFIFLRLNESERRWYEGDNDIDELIYLSALSASNTKGDPFVFERFHRELHNRLSANGLLRLLAPKYASRIQDTLLRFCTRDYAQYRLTGLSPYNLFNREMNAELRLREFAPVVIEELTAGGRGFTLEEYVISLSAYLENGTKEIIADLHQANRLVPELLLNYAEEDEENGLFYARNTDTGIIADPTGARISLRQMDPTDFEQLIGDYFLRRGFVRTEVIGRSRDRGVDVLATNSEGELELIQCKRYREGNNVGSTAIQRVDSYLRTRHGKKAWVVTTSDFTPEGYDEARITGVITINGNQLMRSLEVYYPGVYKL